MPSVRHPRPLWRALAAAAIVALVAGAWWMAATVGSGDGRSVRVASAMIEQRTMRGQRLMVTLSDGSTVMLGPESVLRYAPTYGAASRTVELDGEAYFDVLHDDARPFLVKAGNAIARDIGTRFVVQARRGAAVAVAVQEGRVALGGADRPMPDAVLLGAHEVGRVDAMGHAVRRREASLDRYLGWTEGRLVFEATPLATVAAELSRWYDVDVELADSGLADLQLTATFHNEPITTVLPMVQASLGLQLVGTRGRHYVLSRR